MSKNFSLRSAKEINKKPKVFADESAIAKEIEEASDRGRFGIVIDGILSPELKEKLDYLGYKVEEDKFGFGFQTEIKW